MVDKKSCTQRIEFKRSALNISIDPVDVYDLSNFEKIAYEKRATPEQAVKLANHEIVFGKPFYAMDVDTLGEAEAKRHAYEMIDKFDDLYVIKAQFSLKMGAQFVPTSTVFMRYLKDNQSENLVGLSTPIIQELMKNGSMVYQHTLQSNLPQIEGALGQYYKHILKWQNNDKKLRNKMKGHF